MATLEELFGQNLAADEKQADDYINSLLSDAGGDRDFAIRQLTREHELALGTDNQARAQFLEKVADKLEQRIGTIPYDYEVGTRRTEEDYARTVDVAKRQEKTALQRLAEDEKVWKEEKALADQEAKTTQQEGLLKRGILSGTREGAEGLAGSEVKKLDTELSRQLSAYDRALGRSREDITTQTADTLFGAERGRTRTLEDLKTDARRGAIGAGDKLAFGTEAAQREFEAKRKALERERYLTKQYSPTRALEGLV